MMLVRYYEVRDCGHSGSPGWQVRRRIPHYVPTSNIPSTSTAARLGSAATPTAVRACLPASPINCTTRSDAPFTTAGTMHVDDDQGRLVRVEHHALRCAAMCTLRTGRGAARDRSTSSGFTRQRLAGCEPISFQFDLPGSIRDSFCSGRQRRARVRPAAFRSFCV